MRHGKRRLCRDPSALPHFPTVVRLTVGMTMGNADGTDEAIVDLNRWEAQGPSSLLARW